MKKVFHSRKTICFFALETQRTMGIQNKITREIFEGKYPSEMLYENYLLLLEEGFELLKKEND